MLARLAFKWRRAVTLLVVAGAGGWVLDAAPVEAAVPNPPADGTAPGAALVGTVLGWLKWGGLASALAGLLIGAISMGVGHFGSNYSASSAGRKWLMGGMGAAILSGLAWTIATTLYTATGPDMAGATTTRLIAMLVAAATPFVGGCSDASKSVDVPAPTQPPMAQIGASLDDARSLAIAAVASTGNVAAAGFASRSDLIESFTTTEFAPVLLDQTNEQLRDLTLEITGRGADPSNLRAVEVPLTAKIIATNDGAQAKVWSVLVVAVPGTSSPLQTWHTVTLDLVEDGDRWAINGWRSAPGPTPIPSTEGAYDAASAFEAPLSWPPVIDKAVR